MRWMISGRMSKYKSQWRLGSVGLVEKGQLLFTPRWQGLFVCGFRELVLSSMLGCLQGVRPLALQKVTDPALAEFIGVCIGPKEARPTSRQLLKKVYFDSIRGEKCSALLKKEALAGNADVFSDCGCSTHSRTSSVAGELFTADELALGFPRSRSHSPAPASARPLGEQDVVSVFSDGDAESVGATDGSGSGPGSETDGLVHLLPPVPEEEGGALDSAMGMEALGAHHLFSEMSGSGEIGAEPEGDGAEFRVSGKILEEESKLNLRLRIRQPGGALL